MAKDHRTYGRKLRTGETAKRNERRIGRRDARKVTSDGAGARDPGNPQRHHR